MTIKSYSLPRLRAIAALAVAAALLLSAVAMSQSQSLENNVRRAIAGAESTSPNGLDPCADFRTARDQYVSDGMSDNVQQTFKNYALAYADKGARYTVGKENSFIKKMEKLCNE